MFDFRLFKLPGVNKVLVFTGLICLLRLMCSVICAYCLAFAGTSLMEGRFISDFSYQLVFLCFALIVSRVLYIFQSHIVDAFARERTDEISSKALRAVLDRGSAFVNEQGTGRVMSSLIESTDMLENYISLLLPKMVALLIVPLCLLVLCFIIDWVSAVIMLLSFPAIILYMWLIGSNAQDRAAEQLDAFNALSNYFADSLKGLPTLKLFGKLGQRAIKIRETGEKLRIQTLRTLRLATLSSTVLDFASTLSLAAIAVMMGFRLVDGSLELFSALMVLVLVPDFYRPVQEFGANFHATLDGKIALSELCELSEQTFRYEALQSKGEKHGVFDDRSYVEFDKVSFQYDDNPNDERHLFALKDIDVRFSGFARIALVGLSGAGKSTFLKMVAGYLPPDNGSASCVFNSFGEKLQLYSEAWRSQVIYIPQFPGIMNATLAENIALYRPDASIDELQDAASAAGLEDLIAELDEGLLTTIGVAGRPLSGGERQRICLARAFLAKDRPVLILDEPCAHLDVETEYELKPLIKKLMENHLVLMATHRLHWIEDVDEVFLVDRGGISKFSTPCSAEELLRHLKALYPDTYAGVRL